MIDIHCHILAGVDDGAADLQSSLAMAREAVANGITTIIATPHHMNGIYTNHRDDVIAKVDELNQRLSEDRIPLTILPSQEIRIYENVIEDVINKRILSLDPQHKYILLELPSQTVPHNLDRIVFDLQVAGITPIIPHPERNSSIRENPNILYRAIKTGAVAQATSASVVGHFGKSIEKFTRELIEHGLVHMIASDAHNTGIRGPRLQAAYDRLQQYGGAQLVADYQNNVHSILQGKDLWVNEPSKILQRKKFLGIF